MLNGNLANSMNIQAQEKRVYEHFLNQSHTKTAQDPKGSLVHRNPIQSAASGFKNTGKDIVNLGKALKDGTADDCSLGRLNDIGMKLGGFGIAAYLATRKNTPKAKIMEFIGAGVFFSMMQLWQKIFIATPIKARFGIDINQKFTDSLGREKELYLDNQYIPQLRSQEELEVLADKLGLPKDMAYRKEYAQEQERRIALQGRTLNMLTAGIGVPVMTALTCNRIEKYIDGTVINGGLSKAKTTIGVGLEPQDAIDHFSNVVNSRAKSFGFGAEAENIIKSYSNYTGEVNNLFFNGLSRAFNPASFVEGIKLTKDIPDLTPKMADDLKAMFASLVDENSLSGSVLDLFMEKSAENDGMISMKVLNPEAGADAFSDISIDKSKLEAAIQNVISRVKRGEVEYEGASILNAIRDEESLLVITKGAAAGLDDTVIEGLREIRRSQLFDEGYTADVIEDMLKNGDSILEKMIEDEKALLGVVSSRNLIAVPSDIADGKALSAVIEQAKKDQVPTFMEKVKANFGLSKSMGAVLSSAEDVISAMDNSFGKEYFSIVDILFDMLKPDWKTLEMLRSDADFASDYIQKAFIEVASDDAKYETLINKIKNTPVMADEVRDGMAARIIENCREKLDLIRHGNGIKGNTGFDSNLKTLIELTDRTTGSSLGLLGTIEKYLGESIPGIDATKNRIIVTLDLERRIADGTLKAQWDALQAKAPITDTFEDLIANCRSILYDNTANDFANTHHIKQNGAYFKRLNEILFNQPMSDKTIDIVSAAKENVQNADNHAKGLLRQLNEMRISLMAIGSNGTKDYANRGNVLNVDMISDNSLKQLFNDVAASTFAVKFQRVGKPIKDLIFENGSEKFNSKTWMRIFAPLAMTLIGVTFLAQIFIGKERDKHLYMHDSKSKPSGQLNQGAVNVNK